MRVSFSFYHMISEISCYFIKLNIPLYRSIPKILSIVFVFVISKILLDFYIKKLFIVIFQAVLI